MGIQSIRNFVACVGRGVVADLTAIARWLWHHARALWHADEWSLRAISRWVVWQVSPCTAAACTLFHTLVDMEQAVEMYDTTLYWEVGNERIQIEVLNFCDTRPVILARTTEDPMFIVDTVFVQKVRWDITQLRRALLGMLRSLLSSAEYCAIHTDITQCIRDPHNNQMLRVQATLRVLEYMYVSEDIDQHAFVLAAAVGTRWLAATPAAMYSAAVRTLCDALETGAADLRLAEKEARQAERAARYQEDD